MSPGKASVMPPTVTRAEAEDLLRDVRTATERVVEADRAVAAAEAALVRIRQIAAPGFHETRETGPPPPTAVEQFRARLRLPSLEAALAEALEKQEAARATLTRAQAAARQQIATRFRDTAAPVMAASSTRCRRCNSTTIVSMPW